MAGEEGERVVLGLGDWFSVTEIKKREPKVSVVFSIGGGPKNWTMGTVRPEDVGNELSAVSFRQIYDDWVQIRGDGAVQVSIPQRTTIDLYGHFRPFSNLYVYGVVVARVEPQSDPTAFS